MLFGLFITLGVAVLSVALRSYESSLSQKVGAFGILTASFLGIYYITGSWILGLLSALSWLRCPGWKSSLAFAPFVYRKKNRSGRKVRPPSKSSRRSTRFPRRSKAKASSMSATPVGIGLITSNSFGSITKRKIARRRRSA